MKKFKVIYSFADTRISAQLGNIGLTDSSPIYDTVFKSISGYVSYLNALGYHFLTVYDLTNNESINEKTINIEMDYIIRTKLINFREEFNFLYDNFKSTSFLLKNDIKNTDSTYKGKSNTMSEDSPQDSTIGIITTPFIKNNAVSENNNNENVISRNSYGDYRKMELIERFKPFLINRLIPVYNSVCEEFQTTY